MKSKSYFLLFLIFQSFITAEIFAAEKKYIISASEAFAFTYGKMSLSKVFTRIYSPLKITPTIQIYPATRGLALVNEGKLSAEAARFSAAVVKYSNLIKISVPLYKNTIGLFCLEKSKCRLSSALSVAIASGTLFLQEYCKQQNLNCHSFKNYESAFQAVTYDRADALLASRFSQHLCNTDAKLVYFKEIPELTQYSYHFVHKSLSHLVPRLEESIKKLVKERFIEQVINENLDALVSCNIKVKDI